MTITIQTFLNVATIFPLQDRKVPWLKIVSSSAVWAIIVGHMSFNFGHYAVMTKLPAYMKEVLGLDIQAVSGLSNVSLYIYYKFF